MEWHFREVEPRPVEALEIRNPLREVRWWAFLRGDAYVNPFHDLLYALSRSSRKRGATERRFHTKLRSVRFHEDRLDIEWPSGRRHELPYAELSEFDLRYRDLYAEYPAATVGPYTPLTLQAQAEGDPYKLHLYVARTTYLKLLNYLYEHRVPFREFYNGTRTFKMQGLSYEEVQKVKATYGVRW